MRLIQRAVQPWRLCLLCGAPAAKAATIRVDGCLVSARLCGQHHAHLRRAAA